MSAIRAAGRGAVAGFAGALVMSVSTNVEMRLRGRPPSDAPARAIGRLLGVEASSRSGKAALAFGGHLATSVSLGAARGALGGAGVPPAPAGAALFGLALLPEVVVVPALGAGPPPWRWDAYGTAIAVLHHGVFAGATNAAYALLERRAGASW